MLRLLSIAIICCGFLSTTAQQVEYVEYFFDTDPGKGLGVSISVVSGTEVGLDEFILLDGLSIGMHTLFLRSRNSENQWSHTFNRNFVIFKADLNDKVEYVEYFIDEDPGFGSAHEVSFTTEGEVMLDFTTLVIPEGFHNLFIRSRNTSGAWSMTFHRALVTGLSDLPNLSKLEYYFDDDPGYGLGVDVPFTPIPQQDFVILADVSALTGGFHQFFLRSQDENGKWSHTYAKSVFLANTSNNLTAFEYFFDTDPGFGNGTQLPISSDVFSGQLNIDLSDASVSNGMHTLFYRSQNDAGIWSMTSNSPFLKIGIGFFDPLPDIRSAEYYISSADTLVDPGYGNGIQIPIEAGTESTGDFMVDLSNLQEETYTIVVRAQNSKGGWSQIAYGEFMVSIPDPQTITFTIIEDKTYGGGTFLLEATASSLLPVTFLSGNTDVATIDVDQVTILTAGESVITASQEGDLFFEPAESVINTLTVNKASLTATAEDKSKTYAEANPDLSVIYTGFVNLEDESVLDTAPTPTTSATSTSDAGSYDITLSDGTDNNYVITEVSGTFTINQAVVTATADDKSKVYGTDNPILTTTYAGFVNGEDESVLNTLSMASTAANLTSDVGTYDITLSGGDDNNYSITEISGTLDVSQATLTAMAEDKTKAYGADNPTLTAAYDGFLNGDDELVLNEVPSLTTDATVTSDVGSYDIILSGGSDTNYDIINSTTNGTLTVEQATLTATADDKSKIYGTENPELTVTYSGFANNENTTVLDQSPVLSTTATTTSDVGTYDITFSSGNDNNYAITELSGTLTINKADQTIIFEELASVDQTVEDFDLLASATSELSVSFVSGDISIATVTGSTVSILGSGDVTITASQDGNNNFNSAPSVDRSLSINAVLSFLSAEEPDVILFPNPTFNYFRIENIDLSRRVYVSDLNGNIVKSFEFLEGANYNVQGLSKGLHFVLLEKIDGDIVVSKLVID